MYGEIDCPYSAIPVTRCPKHGKCRYFDGDQCEFEYKNNKENEEEEI